MATKTYTEDGRLIGQLLLDKADELCDYLDPECSIITSLISERIFTTSDEDKVSEQGTSNGKVYQIIKILSSKSNISYQQFMNILKNKDQEHIVYILTEGRKGSPPICNADLWHLRDRRLEIIDNMEPIYEPLVSKLITLGVFTDLDRQRVESVDEVHYKRNEQILNILVRKPQTHFDGFIKALNEMQQGHVAGMFDLRITGTVKLEDPSAGGHLQPAIRRDVGDETSELRESLGHIGISNAEVSNGSIRISFRFYNRETLSWILSDELDRIFTEIYRELLSHIGMESIHIEIPKKEIEQCRKLISARKKLMRPLNKKALERSAEEISGRVAVEEELLKDLSLCKYQRDAILHQGSDEDKARVLLQVMSRRPDCEFQILVNALRRTEQDYAANFITSKF